MVKILKNLKKQGIEFFKNFENRLLESNTFNVLKEKYQSLNLGHQKIIKYGLITFLFMLIMYLPIVYLSSSIRSWSGFKQKYRLSLELLKIRNKKSSLLNLSEEDLKLKVNTVVQKYTSSEFELTGTSKNFPKAKTIRQVDFDISLKHLNIKQAIRLGAELNDLPQIRLSAISLLENEEYEKHYDIAYKLSAFVSTGSKAQAAGIKRRPINRKHKFVSPKEANNLTEAKTAVKKRKKRAGKRKIQED